MNRHPARETRPSDESYFVRRMFLRQYIPALLSALTLTASDIADAVVIGNSMGLVGLAAMAFALPIFMIYNVIMHSFGLGGSIHFATRMARGEEQAAGEGFRGVFRALVLIGLALAGLGNLLIHPLLQALGADPGNAVLFSAARTYIRLLLASAPFFLIAYGLGYYMRNAGLEKEASLCASVGNACDVILNIILVFFAHLGVLGAGLATMAGVLITCCLQLVFLQIHHSPLRLFSGKADFSGLWSAFRTGFSSSVGYVYQLIFILLCNNLLMRLSGERGVAVFDIIQNVGYFFAYLYGAVSQAAQPIMSTFQGECNEDGCRMLGRKGVRGGLMIGAAAALALGLLAPEICRFFGAADAETLSLGSWAIRLFSISTLFAGTSSMLASFLQARGVGWFAFLSTTLRGAVLLIPAAILFSFFGERWFWGLYPAVEILSLGIFLLYLRREERKHPSKAPDSVYRATLHDRTEEIGRVTEEIEAFCEKWQASMKQLYFVQMTVEEMCSAIIEYGFVKRGDAGGIIQITLVAEENGVFTLHVRDSAVAFNPFGLGSANVAQEGETADFNAMGMDVIKQKSREFYYRRYLGFNTMVVKI